MIQDLECPYKLHVPPLPTTTSLPFHISPCIPNLPVLSASVRQRWRSVLRGGVAACQSAARVCVCAHVTVSPPTQPFFFFVTAHSQQLCHLPSHFTSLCWQPSISVSITLPACPARRLHYLTNDITTPPPPTHTHVHITPHPHPTPLSLSVFFFPHLPVSHHFSSCVSPS